MLEPHNQSMYSSNKESVKVVGRIFAAFPLMKRYWALWDDCETNSKIDMGSGLGCCLSPGKLGTLQPHSPKP